MAQPTQQFPPWLSPSAFIVTDAAGTPVATETSIVYIPPTYFGPSIPLGTLYSFGGSTEPATVVLPSPTPQTTTTVAPPSTTATPSLTTSLTTTATPTTTVSIPSTTAITTSSLTSATSTTSSTSSLTTSTTSSTSSLTTSTTSFTSSVTSSSNTIPNSTLTSTSAANTSTAVGPAAMAGLTKGQLVGVIVASILGLIFLFVLALFLYLWCRGRRNRRGANTLSQGIDDDYYFVPEGAGRVPGEGSPRHSGEEQDPFLQRSSGAGWAAESSTAGGNSMGVAGGAAAAGAVRAADMAQVPSNGSASRRVPPPPTGSNSSQSTGSHASGFGVLLDRPSMSLGLLPITAEHSEHRTSRQLSDSDMARIGRESVLPDELDQYPDEEYTGAYAYSRYSQHPPPRLVGAATATTPLLGEASPHPSFEEPTLLTARRVKAEDLGPRTASQTSAGSPATAVPSPRGSGGFLGALGLGGLGRLSWFRNLDSPRSSGAAEPSYTTEPLLEKDLETGRGLLSPASAAAADSFGARARGAGPDGTRPYSGVSARSGTSVSGGTLYHDAESSVPGTPVLAPLPRAITPAHAHSPSHSQLALSEQAWLAGGSLPATGGLSGASSPPGYDQPLAGPSAATSPTGTSFDHTHTPAADVLDMPAPPALTHFASISSMKETATVSSVGVGGGYKPAPFPPPGLETVRPVGWADVAGGEASPTGSFGVDMGGRGAERGTDSMIDVLEDAPPDAELGWRAMAAQAMPADMGRRGTFGTYVHGLGGIMSERGSLHSMRSHFSPSSRSTGSAPASRRDFDSSIGSAVSSRPSNNARSPAGSVSHYGGASAHTQSLAHKGSLSSDDRRLGAMSPALSAFGHQARHGSSQSGSGSGGASGSEPPVVPVIDAPPEARMSPEKLGGGRALRAAPSGSDDASAFLDTSFGTIRPVRSLSPLSATFPLNAPWAGGLDNDWQPSA